MPVARNHLGFFLARSSSPVMSSPTQSAIFSIPPCQCTSTFLFIFTAIHTHLKPAPECHQATDIILKSSNGVLFGAHTSNLEQFTHAFPISGSIPFAGEVVLFPDMTSTVLELFLQFTHHQRQPDLSSISFTDLASLAEAVEKYEVYSATEACKANMQCVHPVLRCIPLIIHSFSLQAADHAPQVLTYALKHNHRQICDIAAEHAHDLKLPGIPSIDSAVWLGWVS